MVSEDTKLEVLHAHYVDSCSSIGSTRSLRDCLFLYILVAVSVMLLEAVAPVDTDQALARAIGAKLGLGQPIPVAVLGSVLWFGVFGLTIRYYQVVVHMERQYEYIHALEGQLNPIYNASAFTREGKSYLANYPWFSKWATLLYTMAFPLVLLAVLGGKVLQEFSRPAAIGPRELFDGAAFVGIAVSTGLYLAAVHLRK